MNEAVHAAATPPPAGGARLCVLIPMRDTRIDALLQALAGEALAAALPISVTVFDDASCGVARAQAEVAVARAQQAGLAAQLLRSDHNVGRAAARNALVQASRGPWLLFLDADVLPDEPDFLRRYLAWTERAAGAGAACGGISYRQCGTVAAGHRFYWRYSRSASVAPAERRQQRPWAWLFTANVLVARHTVERFPFDPGFSGYGYEDLEWGLRLDAATLLTHLDNPVSHLGLLTKAALARKTAEAAANLVHLARLHPQATQALGLLRAARRLALLPAPLLRVAAALAGWVFLAAPGPYRLEWAAYQAEKLCRSALACRAAAARGMHR